MINYVLEKEGKWLAVDDFSIQLDFCLFVCLFLPSNSDRSCITFSKKPSCLTQHDIWQVNEFVVLSFKVTESDG